MIYSGPVALSVWMDTEHALQLMADILRVEVARCSHEGKQFFTSKFMPNKILTSSGLQELLSSIIFFLIVEISFMRYPSQY